ncbi:WD40 repeat-like protein [Suillus brevipes Sb2]|nr:WD40 repeat-like protein [Suillus brevipes Sb2]
MASLSKEKETSAITPRQKFEGHTNWVWGAIHLPGGQRIITCSWDGSLRVWNVKSGKQIGDDWRDGDSAVYSIALSPDGKKVVSGSFDGAVRLWDIDTCKVVKKWTGHTGRVGSVCWSRDGWRVLSGSSGGTARQWEVESGETMPEPIENILASIETGHASVYVAAYSPDRTLIATGGWDGRDDYECSIKIWDAKTGKLVATLKGHTKEVLCLAWTKDGKTLISGSYDSSIRTWNTTNWKQTAVLDEHNHAVRAIAISPNGSILASASDDETTRLWNLDNGQPISSPLQHADGVKCVSFSAGGKRLATGCDDKNAYIWDIAAILREAGLDDPLLDPKARKSTLHVNATRPPIQVHPPVNRVPQGFFDGVSPSHSSTRSRLSTPPGTTFLGRLFGHSPSDAQDTSPAPPLDWHRKSDEGIELRGRSPAVVEVPYAKGKRRNACAREKRKRPLPLKKPTAGNSHPPKPNATNPSSQPQAADSSSSTAPVIGGAATTTGTTPTPSRPDIMIRQAGLWTRFWLLICCTSTEHTDGHH